jgi:hypothetical protein
MWGKMLNPNAYWGFRLIADSYFVALVLPLGMIVCWWVWSVIIPVIEKQIRSPVVGALVVPAQVLSWCVCL